MGRGGEDFSKVAVAKPVAKRLHGEAAIQSLNAEVERKTKAAVLLAKKTGTPLPLTFRASLRPLTWGGVGAGMSGYPVYQKRPLAATVVHFLMATYFIVTGAMAAGAWVTAASVVLMFVVYDLFSGVLHVVLDEPANIDLPIIGQPALEFQWHHLIPSDIVRKDFADTVGDLHVVIPCLVGFNMWVCKDLASYQTSMMLMGLKVYMAYFGQYSHRAAHNRNTGPTTKLLQQIGVIISVKDHKAHHTPPHDQDFCLIGICNPVIALMRRVCVNRYAWLGLFGGMSVLSVRFLTLAMQSVVPGLP